MKHFRLLAIGMACMLGASSLAAAQSDDLDGSLAGGQVRGQAAVGPDAVSATSAPGVIESTTYRGRDDRYDDRRYDDDRRYSDDRNRWGRQRTVECVSINRGYRECTYDGRISWADIDPGYSRNCYRDRTWGISSRGIWVKEGCRGRFTIYFDDDDRRYGYDDRYDDRRYDNRYDNNGVQYISCYSRDYNRYTCRIREPFRNVRLYDRRSDSGCRQGQDWGVTRDGVWVRNGCRAVFAYDRGWGRGGRYSDDYGYDRNPGKDRWRDKGRGYDDRYGYDAVSYITCNSKGYKRTNCTIRGRFTNLRIYDRKSKVPCQQGRDWGITSDGIWVQNGCRAVFSYEDGRGRQYGSGYGRR